MMGRKLKQRKPLIYVFCEGESEQAYIDFLKKAFSDVAVIKYPKSTGLFDEADSKFKKDKKYKDASEVTDEIWFFFDVETSDRCKWDARLSIINRLRRLRKPSNIRVRLLMTSGCIEYWFMLHFEMLSPSLQTKAEKESIISKLKEIEPAYEKGDFFITAKIAKLYPTAVENAKKTVSNLLGDGLPGLEDTDKRNKWLCTECKTFSTVYEALDYLENL